MMFAAVICWAAYTIGAEPLIERHSPVGVTGLSLVFGTVLYVPVMWGRIRGGELDGPQPRDGIGTPLRRDFRDVRGIHDLVHRGA